jgi:phosphoribosylformylglycinamidine cyclo-ligase
MTYRDCGVDIAKGEAFARWLADRTSRLPQGQVRSGIGGFAGVYGLPPQQPGEPERLLAATTDGVGTKLLLAQCLERHDTVGIDLVAMCVNDLLAQGAIPLFFLDYFATGALDEPVARDVLSGVITGCSQAGCALLGGETAEMPSFYPPGRYDLAGFAVGEIVSAADHDNIRPGDVVVGLPSSGVHSNGYSLVRTILPELTPETLGQEVPELDTTLGGALLEPTRIYVPQVKPLLQEGAIRAAVHVTGGGLPGNVPRILPPDVGVRLFREKWRVPAVFDVLQRRGGITDAEMYRVFNMGLGMIMVVKEADVDVLLRRPCLHGEARVVGEIVPKPAGLQLIPPVS